MKEKAKQTTGSEFQGLTQKCVQANKQKQNNNNNKTKIHTKQQQKMKKVCISITLTEPLVQSGKKACISVMLTEWYELEKAACFSKASTELHKTKTRQNFTDLIKRNLMPVTG